VRGVRGARAEDVRVCVPAQPTLDLAGVVYTSILNPYDPRKNWQDLLSAYLLALGDCEDATLVVKLVVCPELAVPALNGLIGHYRGMNLAHRCKLVFVTDYLSDADMGELVRGSTYYVNSARAEGSCLPLQDFLAAGRPGLAPTHTSMADYFDDKLGFPIGSHPEPAGWPHAGGEGYTTTWQRIVWQSLHDQFRHSYQVAKQDQSYYQALASYGRSRMMEFAGAENVWPKLAAALDSVQLGEDPHRNLLQNTWSSPIRQAS